MARFQTLNILHGYCRRGGVYPSRERNLCSFSGRGKPLHYFSKLYFRDAPAPTLSNLVCAVALSGFTKHTIPYIIRFCFSFVFRERRSLWHIRHTSSIACGLRVPFVSIMSAPKRLTASSSSETSEISHIPTFPYLCSSAQKSASAFLPLNHAVA